MRSPRAIARRSELLAPPRKDGLNMQHRRNSFRDVKPPRQLQLLQDYFVAGTFVNLKTAWRYTEHFN